MSLRASAILFVTGLVALAVVAVAITGATRDDASSAQVSAPGSEFDGATLPPGVRAPDFTLRDQDGRRVTMREYRGRILAVTFLYSHCKDTCPVQAQQLKGALDDLGHDVPVLAISTDPPGDTPASIRHFNAEQGVGNRIRWVRGSTAQLSKLWKRFGVTGQSRTAEHLSHILLVDRQGMERVGFPPEHTTPEGLAHDLRVLERG